jgi:multicomponent Na+:H+ antiporter subunit G
MGLFRIILASIFLFSGLFTLGIATFGLFRLNNVLNRLHAAAKCDTLGALLVLISLAIIVGPSFTALKFFILIAFIWLTNPVSAFMIARAEVLTNPKIEEECDVREIDDTV